MIVTSCPRARSPLAAWNICCTDPVSKRFFSSIWKMRTARDLSVFILALAVLGACTTDRTRRGYLRDQAEGMTAPPRPVIVIPGFGVTRLFDPETGRYVWGTPRTTVHRQYEDDLDLPPQGRDRLI